MKRIIFAIICLALLTLVSCDTAGSPAGCAHEWMDATCASPKTCKLCKETQGEKTDHDWADATCTRPKICKICEKAEGEVLGHSWVDATCTSPKTCSVCREFEGDALGHTWNGTGTCTNPAVCTVCHDEKEKPRDHTWDEGTCETPKTCLVCHETNGPALGHTWVPATCSEPQTCSTCGKTEGEAGHTWNGPGTCTAPARCTVCHVPKDISRAHSWKDNVNCDLPMVCENCSETMRNPVGHKWRGGSCTEPQTCDYCPQIKEAPGHVWDEPSCYHPSTCRNCLETNGEALGHDWSEATCTSASTCSRCHKKQGKPLPHTYVQNVCTVCSDIMISNIHELARYVNDHYSTVTTAIGSMTSLKCTWESFDDSNPWRTHDYEIIFYGSIYIDDVKSSLEHALIHGNFLPYEQRIRAVIDVLKMQMEVAQLVDIAFPGKKVEIKFFIEGYEYPALEIGYYSETRLCWKNYKPNKSGINGYGSTDLCEWYITTGDFLKNWELNNQEQIVTDILALWKPYGYELKFNSAV